MKFGATFHSSAEHPGAAIFLFMFKCESVRWAVGFLLNHPTLPSESRRLLLNQLPCRRKQETDATFFPTPLSSCPWKENYDNAFDATQTCFDIFTISADTNYIIIPMSLFGCLLSVWVLHKPARERLFCFFNRTWKRWLITRNGKRRKMVLRCPLACDLSQYSTWRPARVFLMKTCGT